KPSGFSHSSSTCDRVQATLLDLGADPNYEDHAGFPSLTATLTCGDRPDMHAILELLLERGADPNVHGFNDYTPLHDAVRMHDRRAVDLLLAHGADPTVKTRIDDYETPLDIARATGDAAILARLEEAAATRG
ncbi:MAG: ankyrin repeat domain-containing protein, partial [Alphaproteobacteria bacterium]